MPVLQGAHGASVREHHHGAWAQGLDLVVYTMITYVYVCMSVCIYIYIYTYMCIYIYIYIHIHVCACVCVHVYIYIYIYIYMWCDHPLAPTLNYWYYREMIVSDGYLCVFLGC